MRKIIKDTLLLAASNVFSIVLTALGTLFVAKILEPDGYGGYSAYKLIISYIINLQLGVFQGLQREIPYVKALGEYKKLQSLLNSVFSFTIYVSIISIFIILIFSLNSSPFFKKIFILTLPFVPLYFFKELFKFSLKGLENFIGLSILNIFDSVTVIFFAIIFSIFFKAEGAVLGFALSHLVLFFLALFITKKIFLGIKLNFEDIKSLFKVGFPIFFIGVLNIFLFSIDRLFILGTYGRESFGIYVMALNFLNLISQVPVAFAVVLLPFLTRKKALEGSLERFIEKDFLIFAYLLFISVLIISINPIICFIINNFLYKYKPALPLLKLLLEFIPFSTLSYFFYSFLIAENKHLFIIPYQIILLPLSIILNSILIPIFGIKGAGISFLISQTLFTLITIFISYRFIKFKLLKSLLIFLTVSFFHFLIFEKFF
ncbi:MAG: lipopolysaccharide biosynthesis protein [Candidatus Hydrothermales bacterium]